MKSITNIAMIMINELRYKPCGLWMVFEAGFGIT